MNGFMLLVLVVMAGQVSPGGLTMPPSLNPVQPASMIATPPPQTDYGWQMQGRCVRIHRPDFAWKKPSSCTRTERNAEYDSACCRGSRQENRRPFWF